MGSVPKVTPVDSRLYEHFREWLVRPETRSTLNFLVQDISKRIKKSTSPSYSETFVPKALTSLHSSLRLGAVDEVEMNRTMLVAGSSPGGSALNASHDGFMLADTKALSRGRLSGRSVTSTPSSAKAEGFSSRPTTAQTSPGHSPLGAPLARPSSFERSLSASMSQASEEGSLTQKSSTTSVTLKGFGQSASEGFMMPQKGPEFPIFYKPMGIPPDPEPERQILEIIFNSASNPTRSTPLRNLPKNPHRLILTENMAHELCHGVFHIPKWMTHLMLERMIQWKENQSAKNKPVDQQLYYTDVQSFYESEILSKSHHRRLFELIRQPDENDNEKLPREYLTRHDLMLLVQEVVRVHPGLQFLTQPEFQDLYCQTVTRRILYQIEEFPTERVPWHIFDASVLPSVLFELDMTLDINTVLQYFSYEHFYVLYSRFWELDAKQSSRLTQNDLHLYGYGTVNPLAISRVAEGYGRPLFSDNPEEFAYDDFVYFCLSEEDKNTETSMRYWFGVLDLDCDGVLSGDDLRQFLDVQADMFAALGGCEQPLEEVLSHLIDSIGSSPGNDVSKGITLAHLKRHGAPEPFLNFLINSTKYITYDQRDPFIDNQMRDWDEQNSWERFARFEYDRLSSGLTDDIV